MYTMLMRNAVLAGILLTAALAVCSLATTYNSEEDLPEPDIVITDRTGDAELAYGSGSAGTGWFDIREIRGYVVEGGVAFAMFCNGSIPSDGVLLLLLDVDGEGGAVGRGPLDRGKCNQAGYDFALGVLGNDTGLFSISASHNWPVNRSIGHWRRGKVAYFEVTWEQLRGMPDTLAISSITEGHATGGVAQDMTPNQGAEILDVLAAAGAGLDLQTVFETGFDGDALDAGWRWLREDPAHWALGERPGFLTITTQEGGLLGDANTACNVLLRDAPSGDFEITTYVEFHPNENFQFAGLIVYESDDRFLALGRAFCGARLLNCVGNGIYFDAEGTGRSSTESFSASHGLGQAYLRITKRGAAYSGYYSADGVIWELIGRHLTSGFTPQEVGLYTADSDTGAREIPAEFDLFRVAAAVAANSP